MIVPGTVTATYNPIKEGRKELASLLPPLPRVIKSILSILLSPTIRTALVGKIYLFHATIVYKDSLQPTPDTITLFQDSLLFRNLMKFPQLKELKFESLVLSFLSNIQKHRDIFVVALLFIAKKITNDTRMQENAKGKNPFHITHPSPSPFAI